MKRLSRILTLSVLLIAIPAIGQDLIFDTDEFASWQYPAGLVNVTDEGVTVKRFGATENAVADIDDHSSITIGQFGSRPARTPTNQFSADRIRDQDETTYWKPNPNDPLQLWWIELDLGRVVVADKVRVIFPDEEGARPFSFFSVFASPGIPVFGSIQPQIVYERIGRPINNNTSQVVEFNLSMTGLNSAEGAHLDLSSTMNFDLVRFIRFEATGATPDAALAEIEVDGVGFNLSSMVGTPTRREDEEPHWGGTTWTSKDRDCEGCGKGSGADEMLDEDVGFRTWTIEGSDKGDWRKSGVWQTIDFGSIFRIDRVIFFPIVAGRSPVIYGFERDKQGSWSIFDFLTSDGSPSNRADPVTEGPFHYDVLSQVENSGRHMFDFRFPPLDMRLLLWRVTKPQQFHRALQLFVYHAEGYPRQVEIESDDLSLGGARSIRRIEWEGEIPEGTRIEVDTQTGNGFDSITRYFLVNGNEITKQAWEAQRSRNRGPVVEEEVRDDTWSAWSDPHRFSGQEFQSPSPRRWMRARVRLISEDPNVMPILRSLRIVANLPLIAEGVSGIISPNEAPLDSLQSFNYVIHPSLPATVTLRHTLDRVARSQLNRLAASGRIPAVTDSLVNVTTDSLVRVSLTTPLRAAFGAMESVARTTFTMSPRRAIFDVRFVQGVDLHGMLDMLEAAVNDVTVTLDAEQQAAVRTPVLELVESDAGFNHIRIDLPERADSLSFGQVSVGGVPVEATVEPSSDGALLINLPMTVLADSVDVAFETRLIRSPSVFRVDVSRAEDDDNAQGVVPLKFGADQVHVPDVAVGRELITNFTHKVVFTPNSDGINDTYEVAFTLVRPQVEVEIKIYSLDGQLVAELNEPDIESNRPVYTWDGLVGGKPVPPGVYLTRIEMKTDARNQIMQKPLHVVY